MMETMESKTLSIAIAAPPARVYAFVGDPTHLPRWAHGLCDAVTRAGDRWLADTPAGTIEIAFAAPNDYGVLDHIVTLPSGARVLNPMRVLANGEGSELLFTLFRTAEMSGAQFDADAKQVMQDLTTLKRLLEGQ